MKMLIIALDGGDKRIIDALDMPFLQSLLRESVGFDVEEDLWSRGWVEILSGLHGRESGGFYSKPKLDGTHDFHSSFGGKDYERNPSITPIWEIINRNGYNVGVMGVNTTMPPPEVEGFFLAGPGGGFKPGIKVPQAACYPGDIARQLNSKGYVWEVRYKASGVRKVSDFFELLRREAVHRVQPFIDLTHRFDVDFGFFHHKTPIVIQNLAMVEIEDIINNGGNPSNEVQREIVDLYKCIDDTIQDVLTSISVDNYMIVSDHGSVPYHTSVNVNSFLKKIGLQKEPSAITVGPKRLMKRIMKAVLPDRQVSTVAQVVPSSVRNTKVDWNRTLAFGARYVSGIYINDQDRFGGPVESGLEARRLLRNIIDEFNASEEAQSYGMRARPYRMNYQGCRFYDWLPDIWIDKPDTVFFEGDGDFVRPNPNYHSITSLQNIGQDMYSGTKGRHPLLYVDNKTAQYCEDGSPGDLSLAYHLIGRVVSD